MRFRLIAIMALCFAALACRPMDAYGQCSNGQCGQPFTPQLSLPQNYNYYSFTPQADPESFRGNDGRFYTVVKNNAGQSLGFYRETVAPIQSIKTQSIAAGSCPGAGCQGAATCPAGGLCSVCSTCTAERMNARLDRIEADVREIKAMLQKASAEK